MDNSINLAALADKYEVSTFVNEDPSQFLRWYPLDQKADVETASFIAAMLSFGNRKLFIPKIKSILQMADSKSGSISRWCMDSAPGFEEGEKKFYRFYSYSDLRKLFKELGEILKKSGSLGNYLKEEYINTNKALYTIISDAFPESKIVPKGKNSANKRIHMFLRWMVRQNSPVDLGIWNWYPASSLIIPLDIHVLTQSIKAGLLDPKAKASLKTAQNLTNKMKEYFPDDPARADFALFGLGVDPALGLGVDPTICLGVDPTLGQGLDH